MHNIMHNVHFTLNSDVLYKPVELNYICILKPNVEEIRDYGVCCGLCCHITLALILKEGCCMADCFCFLLQ